MREFSELVEELTDLAVSFSHRVFAEEEELAGVWCLFLDGSEGEPTRTFPGALFDDVLIKGGLNVVVKAGHGLSECVCGRIECGLQVNDVPILEVPVSSALEFQTGLWVFGKERLFVFAFGVEQRVAALGVFDQGVLHADQVSVLARGEQYLVGVLPYCVPPGC